MIKIITNLSNPLIKEIKHADEIWIAVALLKNNGLEIIQNALPLNCQQNYIIGVDLPTEPKALVRLNKQQLLDNINVRIYSEKAFFHPKVYLIRKGGEYAAFMGSANCTHSGLYKNIELTTYTTDKETCKKLQKWYKALSEETQSLTNIFIEKYKEEYEKRMKRKKEEEKHTKKIKTELKKGSEVILKGKKNLIKKLIAFKSTKDYNSIIDSRKDTISFLKSALDYPNYRKIDIDKYFKEHELGHLIAIPKPKVAREITKFRKMLRYLCNEEIDIAERYERVIKGDLKVEGVNKALVSKVLTAHNPKLYYVKNSKSETTLRKYRITLPRGLSEGQKYKITCNLLKDICKEADIKDLSVLDYYLYIDNEVIKE